ncbi:MAG: helicase-related protein, partial [Candidatus Binatia bacterium]
LKAHARDLLLLSATPHQGDHFRFWMLIQLLNPTLFKSPEDMIENRHRLNAVVFRRTKADACRPDGSPLFARRWVHTESFLMSDRERQFYEELREYLEDGFALAKRQGNQGRALGFVMTIFQKIAASSFAAVRRTLRRRLLALTLYEAILRDRDLDIDGREALSEEAKALIREDYGFGDDAVGQSQVDHVLAELKLRIVKRLDEDELELAADPYTTEFAAAQAEEVAASVVSLALPKERLRIRALLAVYPDERETKAEKLLRALGTLWRENPQEKVVVFATYLGTVELLGKEIDATYPGQGVVVLRGGDHGAKLAAERRFRQKDGPKVLVCTAAGREGINLQFARILFNFDLPWNPMDMEQRIGRIHRYGQNHTAQVYNLVLSDTIEGHIFLLLNDKLLEIAKTLGKLDEQGNIAEDFRSQILGQLSERLSYDRLYRDALCDPELRRTRLELEAALGNATEARKVVFELFQDLEGFHLEDYKPFADVTADIDRLVRFLSAAVEDQGLRVVPVGEDIFELRSANGDVTRRFTTKREVARERADLDLLGLDHPIVDEALRLWRELSPQDVGVSVEGDGEGAGVLSWWLVESRGKNGEQRIQLEPLAVRGDGTRMPRLERLGDALLRCLPAPPLLDTSERLRLLKEHLEPMLYRELQQSGLVKEEVGFSTRLVGWIEVQQRTRWEGATEESTTGMPSSDRFSSPGEG